MSRLPGRARLYALAFIGVLAIAAAPAVSAKPIQPPGKAPTTQVQVLGLNDFHGNLRPPTGSSGRIGGSEQAGNAGGVEFLATHVRQLRATNPNTLFVSAGDLIGATPLISAAFHDEPTIEAFNMLDLDYNGVGNHEFDEGVGELLRMQNGGCHADGCYGGDGFAGADFDFLAANVTYKGTDETIFPPFAIHHFGGIKIGVVGMTLEATPTIVTAEAVADVDFHDEADAVNDLVPILKENGVETIIVLLHEGGTHFQANGVDTVAINPTTINSCVNPQGPVIDVVDRMDAEIDVVITGHTNWAVNCVRPDGKLMTGAASFGRLVTDIDLTISRATKDVVRSATLVNNRIVTRTVPKAADLEAHVARYAVLAAPTENRHVGTSTSELLRANNAAGESVLGDLITDAQLDATDAAAFPGGPAVLAFMNSGGIRTDINAGITVPNEITYGEAFEVQPFGNILVTMDMTGQAILDVLNQQVAAPPGGLLGNGILQISHTVSYTRTAGGPSGAEGDTISNVLIQGNPVNPTATYRVTVNNFLADGGDNYTAFRSGTNRHFGVIDLDAFSAYLTANEPTSPTPRNRMTLVTP